MPSGSSFDQQADWNKEQGGPIGADAELRKMVNVGAISAGVEVHVLPGTTDLNVVVVGAVSITGGVSVTGTVTVSGTVTLDGTVIVDASQSATPACTRASLAGGGSQTEEVIAAQATTAIQVRGFSLYNAGANDREMELRFGGTAFWCGGLVSKGAFNWNMIGHYQRSANNKSVILWVEDDTTVRCTVYYKEV